MTEEEVFRIPIEKTKNNSLLKHSARKHGQIKSPRFRQAISPKSKGDHSFRDNNTSVILSYIRSFIQSLARSLFISII